MVERITKGILIHKCGYAFSSRVDKPKACNGCHQRIKKNELVKLTKKLALQVFNDNVTGV